MRRALAILFVILSLTVVLPLAGCSANRDPALASKEEALDRARELFPELIQGREREFQIRHSHETIREMGWSPLLIEKVWNLDWYPPTNGSESIHIELSAADGSLSSLDYQLPVSPDLPVERLLSREEAEKIAYDFACKHHPGKMAEMVPDTDETASDSRLNLEYSFGWSRFFQGIPVSGNYIDVQVHALTGEVTHFSCGWDETAIVPPEKVISPEELNRLALDQLGLYPCYISDRSGDSVLPEARLVYELNSNYSRFDSSTGKPITYYGDQRIEWIDAKRFSQDFAPIPAPEQKAATPVPNKRISKEEGKATASEFFKKIGLEGTVSYSGSSSKSGPGYYRENWRYEVVDYSQYPSQKEIEVEIDTDGGKVVGFSHSRSSKEGVLVPGQFVSLREPLQSIPDFLAAAGENTENMALWNEMDLGDIAYSLRNTSSLIRWVGLVNGVPFPEDTLRIRVSRRGEIQEFKRTTDPVSRFASTRGILSPREASAIWKNNQHFSLGYDLVILKNGKKRFDLVYNLGSDAIDAHTGQKFESISLEKMAPYRAKFKAHRAEIPLDLLAQTGRLPTPEAFDPDAFVTRREALKILEMAGMEDAEERRLFSPFPDVSVNDPDLWAFLHAVWCGIIEPAGNLRPEDPLTREEAALWLVNLIRNEEKMTESPHQIDQAAVTQDLILAGTGNGNSSRPGEPITWGELAVMITRAVPYLN